MAQPDQNGGLAIAGLILGIISIPTAFILCGIVFGIVGIVLSALGRRSVSHRTMATVGLALSIVGVAIVVIIFAVDFVRGFQQGLQSG
jgi:hypothetical protein